MVWVSVLTQSNEDTHETMNMQSYTFLWYNDFNQLFDYAMQVRLCRAKNTGEIFAMKKLKKSEMLSRGQVKPSKLNHNSDFQNWVFICTPPKKGRRKMNLSSSYKTNFIYQITLSEVDCLLCILTYVSLFSKLVLGWACAIWEEFASGGWQPVYCETLLFLSRFWFLVSYHGIFTRWWHYDLTDERGCSFWRCCTILHGWKYLSYTFNSSAQLHPQVLK